MKRFPTLTREERVKKITQAKFNNICLVLENLTEDLNISAILRTAEGFGLSSVYIIYPNNKPRLSNTVSSGAIKWLDIKFATSTKDCLTKLKKDGFYLIGALVDPDAANLWHQDLNRKIAIVVGNETTGLSEQAIKLVDKNVYIPMFGMTESFNVSVSATVMIYEAIRQNSQQ